MQMCVCTCITLICLVSFSSSPGSFFPLMIKYGWLVTVLTSKYYELWKAGLYKRIILLSVRKIFDSYYSVLLF